MEPDTKVSGSYYLFVANGNLETNIQILPAWSMVFVYIIGPTQFLFLLTC